MDPAKPILIISTGRTGTIFFAQLFRDLYPQVAAYHESGYSRLIQFLTNVHFAGLLPRSAVVLTWKIFKGNQVRNCTKEYYLDANSFLYGLTAIAPELYPNLKVVHIVRDPRSYVTSHLNFSRYRRTSFIANYFIPLWQPNPFLSGEISWKKFFKISRFERFCWIWDFKNRVMASLEVSEIPYFRIRFEDIFCADDPEQIFGIITDFIGLPRSKSVRNRFSRPVNQAPRNIIPDWLEWKPKQCAQLQALCGDSMKKYGYGDEPDWRARVQAYSDNLDL